MKINQTLILYFISLLSGTLFACGSEAIAGSEDTTGSFPALPIKYSLYFSSEEEAQNIAVGSKPKSNPVALIHADINQDSYEDLISANENDASLGILLWNPEQEKFDYAKRVLFSAEKHPVAVQAADFTSDGIIDLLVAYQTNPTINPNLQTLLLLKGKGDGTFSSQISIPSFVEPQINAMTVGDYTNDGILDVALAVQHLPSPSDQQSGVMILPGQKLQPLPLGNPLPAIFSSNQKLYDISSFDFNQDGKLDFVVHQENSLVLLTNQGNHNFSSKIMMEDSWIDKESGLTQGHLFGQKNVQLLISNPYSSTDLEHSGLYSFWNQGTTEFQSKHYSAQDLNLTAPGLMMAADFNGDGLDDLAVIDHSNNQNYLNLFQSKPDGTFLIPANPILIEEQPANLLACDFNHDGKVDLAVSNQYLGRVQIFLNQSH